MRTARLLRSATSSALRSATPSALRSAQRSTPWPALRRRAAIALAIACASASAFAFVPARPARAQPAPIAAPARVAERAPTPAALAQLVPASLAEARYWGTAPDGALRATIAGMRVLAYGDGAFLSVAQERFAAEPAWVVALPDRLGGGYLFAVGKAIWRAETWLGPASPIFSSTGTITEILVGLDRAYVRYPQGSLAAFDAKTGARMGIGPLPSAPHLGRVVAIDAWRAAAIADLEGVRFTNDAGNSWRPIGLSTEPLELVPLPDGVAVGGKDRSRHLVWNAVREGGAVEPLDAPPPRLGTPLPLVMKGAPNEGAFGGASPLLAAVEDGWPLGDGTAVVARDGAIARVRLSDGRVVETEADAFSMKPSRCRAIALRPPAFGFACGEPRGATEVLAYDAPRKAVAVLGHWADPREVLSFGNGALAVRGSCERGERAVQDRSGRPQDGLRDGAQPREERYCIGVTTETRGERPQAPGWNELRIRGEQPDRARLAVLADGRALLVRPPTQGDLSTARITLIDGPRQTARAIRFPTLRADAARALRYGVWLDGLEERRPGVVGGWIDAAGSVVGIELPADDAEARVGEYIRDAGSPVVSGPWGFGWTASRGGFETVDGGMTWTKEIALPEPIAEPVAGRERSCGPVGCVVAGWIRVGWGEAVAPPPPLPPEPVAAAQGAARGELRLSCEREYAGAQRLAGERIAVKSTGASSAPSGDARAPRKAMTPAMWGAVTEFASFFGAPGPALGADDIGFAADASAGFERALHGMPFARVHAWGPRSGEWDTLGRWQVRWTSPWGGDTRSSSVAAVPWTTLDMARRALGIGPAVPTSWATAVDDDADHALLVARHNQESPVADVWLLESGRAPIEVRPSGTDAFPDVQAAARFAGHWVLATTQGPSESPAAVLLWRVDGDVAREIGRIARAGFDGGSRVRFARRSDGRGLGLAVEGQPDLGQPPALWVAGIDTEGGAVTEPVEMAPFDGASGAVHRSVPVAPPPSRAGGTVCTADDAGWEVEMPYAQAVRATSSTGVSWVLRGTAVVARVGVERSCVAAVAGVAEGDDLEADGLSGTGASRPRTSRTSTDSDGPAGAREPGRPQSPMTATVPASLLFPEGRVSLRCWQR